MSFIKDFNRANKDISLFLSEINGLMTKGDRLIEIESSSNPILNMFDQHSGVDAIQITKDKQIRGVALRVQYGNAWDTFTIRYRRSSGAKTEYEKRVEALQNEKMYPQLTIQCYLSEDGSKILSVGIIKTRDLYEQLERNNEKVKKRVAKEDGNIFKYISFYDLHKILIYKNGIKKYIK